MNCVAETMLRTTTRSNAGFRPPEARVLVEDDLRRRAVLPEHVRPAPGAPRRGRVEPPLGLVRSCRRPAASVAPFCRASFELTMPSDVFATIAGIAVFGVVRAEDDRVPAARRDRHAREQEGRIALEVDQPPEREDDVGGRHRRAVGEPDVAPQIERVRPRVPRRPVAPGREQDRARDVAAPEGQERVVDAAVDDRRGRLERPLRVGRPDLERAVDDERVLRPARRSRRRERTRPSPQRARRRRPAAALLRTPKCMCALLRLEW